MLEPRTTLPIQNIVLAVVIIVELSVHLSIFPAVSAQNLPNDNSSNRSSDSVTQYMQKFSINAEGPITSAQRDNNGTWIIWGDWHLINNASNPAKAGLNPFSFNATINKVKPDNTEGTTYKISNFKVDTPFIKTNESSSQLIFNGTATIQKDRAESSQVPIKITIIDGAPITATMAMDSGSGHASWIPVHASWIPKGGTISIFIDNKAFPEFDGSQVYGIVNKGKS